MGTSEMLSLDDRCGNSINLALGFIAETEGMCGVTLFYTGDALLRFNPAALVLK